MLSERYRYPYQPKLTRKPCSCRSSGFKASLGTALSLGLECTTGQSRRPGFDALHGRRLTEPVSMVYGFQASMKACRLLTMMAEKRYRKTAAWGCSLTSAAPANLCQDLTSLPAAGVPALVCLRTSVDLHPHQTHQSSTFSAHHSPVASRLHLAP